MVSNLDGFKVVSTIVFYPHFSHFPTVKPISKGLSFLSMTHLERCKEIIFSLIFSLSICDVTKEALFGQNMLNCTKTSKKKQRIV